MPPMRPSHPRHRSIRFVVAALISSPEDVYAATTAALKAGAQGVIFSRKYSEMRLANLAAGGRAVKEFVR
jgi:hypothetical protein